MDDLRRMIQESIAVATAAALAEFRATLAEFRDEQQALVESAVARAASRRLPSADEGGEQWVPTGRMAAILGLTVLQFRNWARNPKIKALGRPDPHAPLRATARGKQSVAWEWPVALVQRAWDQRHEHARREG